MQSNVGGLKLRSRWHCPSFGDGRDGLRTVPWIYSHEPYLACVFVATEKINSIPFILRHFWSVDPSTFALALNASNTWSWTQLAKPGRLDVTFDKTFEGPFLFLQCKNDERFNSNSMRSWHRN